MGHERCTTSRTAARDEAGGKGNLTALAPYQPFFVGAALVLLALGLVRVYRRPRLACADGDTCARPLPARGMKVVLWASLALVILAVAFPYVAPLFIPA